MKSSTKLRKSESCRETTLQGNTKRPYETPERMLVDEMVVTWVRRVFLLKERRKTTI